MTGSGGLSPFLSYIFTPICPLPYILDGLFNMAELRVGTGAHAEVVRIYRCPPQAMRCPGDSACPVWSERMAGR
jgi:hypothetical protein